MGQWQLDSDRVRGVLRTVEEQRGTLEEALDPMDLRYLLLDVSGGGWAAAAVPQAVDLLLADQAARLTRMRGHIDAGVVGVSLAAAAYDAAQLEMATTFEQQALAAADGGDLDWFAPYLER